jgi:phage terminase Nu1 subunit (DNA packaging protein)
MAQGRRRERARTTRVAEMAEFAGVSEQAFRKWMTQPGFPVAPDGSVCLWDLAVWRDRMDRGSDIDGELGGDVDSPGLERYRLARAEQEEIKLQKMRGEYLPREDVHTALMETAAVMKSAGERVVRTFGNEVASIINSAWDEVIQRLESRFGDDSADAGTDGSGGDA